MTSPGAERVGPVRPAGGRGRGHDDARARAQRAAASASSSSSRSSREEPMRAEPGCAPSHAVAEPLRDRLGRSATVATGTVAASEPRRTSSVTDPPSAGIEVHLELPRVLHGFAVEREHDVPARSPASPRARRAGRPTDHATVAREAEPRRERGCDRLRAGADLSAPDAPACRICSNDRAHDVARRREAEPSLPPLCEMIRVLMPDDATVDVHERAAAVAGVDRASVCTYIMRRRA